jgi:hypothetical protein
MSLLIADELLREAAEELRVLLEEDAETGEYVDPAGSWAHAALKTIESSLRLLERARREQVRGPTAGLRAVSDRGATN